MEFLRLKSPAEFLSAARVHSRQHPMSIRQLSGKLGYSSDRTVGMVPNGQRQMSSEMQARIVKMLKLTPKEQLHLQKLIRLEREGSAPTATTPPPVPTQVTALAADRLHPLIPAYSLVVLEILRLEKRPLATLEIQSRLREKVELDELAKCLHGLSEAGLIKSDQEGFFRALGENEFVTTSLDIPSAVIREIHRTQLARASAVLEEQSTADREFIAKTLTVSSERLPEIKRLLRQKLEEMAEEISELSEGDLASVVQLNLQFYLQSK